MGMSKFLVDAYFTEYESKAKYYIMSSSDPKSLPKKPYRIFQNMQTNHWAMHWKAAICRCGRNCLHSIKPLHLNKSP